jgi:type VI secretion system protein ImpJ
MPLDTAKVIWSEGLFLRPHHFQQLERHLEALLEARLAGFGAQAQSGFLRIEIDPALLLQGKVQVASAAGLFPDGTPFELPAPACLLEPFDVPEGTRDQVIHLGVMLRRASSKTVALDARATGAPRTRYAAVDATIADNVAGFDGEAELKVGALQLSLGTQETQRGTMATLPVARVVERQASRGVVLDPKFVPPLLDVAAHPVARGWLEELHGLVRQRAEALAGRMVHAAAGGVADTADFLLLLACNRFEPLLAQLRQVAPLHPQHLYCEMLRMAGECATFGRESRRVPELPLYRHLALAECFGPVMEEIRRALAAVIDPSVVRIPLRDIGKGVYRADVPDARLVSSGFFVLAAAAQVSVDRLRAAIPMQVKIGPPEKLRDMVMLNLPGIELESLQYPPRQIPFHANFSYFQLDKSNALWQAIEVSRAMGLYVAGDLPGLDMQLWVVRT